MGRELRISQMIEAVHKDMESFPDHRRGRNIQYEIADAGMGAFSVFFTQCASFLEHQRELKLLKGRSNMESIFAADTIPSDNQIRNLLDEISPEALGQT